LTILLDEEAKDFSDDEEDEVSDEERRLDELATFA
jgi:hypothetical protein